MTIDIIIPVHYRHHRIAPLVENIISVSPADVTVTLVGTASDAFSERVAHSLAGAIHYISSTGRSFAYKCNLAYRSTTAPWLLFVGDDVHFHAGWYESFGEAAETGAQFISTNDMHNPAVTSGRHAIHPIISREYIDTVGASFDGPGSVAHEGYQHKYVDNEWTYKAQADGVYMFAPDIRIEHMHQVWGDAAYDRTYLEGDLTETSDYQLCQRRKNAYLESTTH